MAEPSSQDRDTSDRLTAPLACFIEFAVLILIGGAGILDGWRIITTKADIPGGIEAGGWIAALGALLIIGASIHIALYGIRGDIVGAPAEPDATLKRPLIAVVLLLVYVALITPLGYVLATALFAAAYLRLFSQYGLLPIAAIAIPFAAGSGWLWSVLNMSLPQGVLPWP